MKQSKKLKKKKNSKYWWWCPTKFPSSSYTHLWYLMNNYKPTQISLWCVQESYRFQPHSTADIRMQISRNLPNWSKKKKEFYSQERCYIDAECRPGSVSRWCTGLHPAMESVWKSYNKERNRKTAQLLLTSISMVIKKWDKKRFFFIWS